MKYKIIIIIMILVLVSFFTCLYITEGDHQIHQNNIEKEYKELCESNNFTFNILEDNRTLLIYYECYKIEGEIIKYYKYKEVDGKLMLVDN